MKFSVQFEMTDDGQWRVWVKEWAWEFVAQDLSDCVAELVGELSESLHAKFPEAFESLN